MQKASFLKTRLIYNVWIMFMKLMLTGFFHGLVFISFGTSLPAESVKMYYFNALSVVTAKIVHVEGAGLCLTLPETPKTAFLMTKLKCTVV